MLDRLETYIKSKTQTSDTLDSFINSKTFLKDFLLSESSSNETLSTIQVRIADIFDPELEQIAEYSSKHIQSLQLCGQYKQCPSETDQSDPNHSHRKFVDIYGFLGLIDRQNFEQMLLQHPESKRFESQFENVWKSLSSRNSNKKCQVQDYFPVLIYMYSNDMDKQGVRIGDFLEVKGMWHEATELETNYLDQMYSFHDFEASYRDFYESKLVPSFFVISSSPVQYFSKISANLQKEAELEHLRKLMEQMGVDSNKKENKEIEQIYSIVCSKLFYGALDILKDETSALMLTFALLSSKNHKTEGQFIDFISLNLFNVTPSQRLSLLQFLDEVGMKHVYINISSKSSKIDNSENENTSNVFHKENSKEKNNFSKLKTEQFTFDHLIGKQRLFGEKCHETGVVLQGSVLPKDHSSVLLTDETTLASSKKFDPFSSNQLFGLQNVIATNTIQWDFKFGTTISHCCAHKMLGLSASLSIMDFKYKVHVGTKFSKKVFKKELKVIQEESEENSMLFKEYDHKDQKQYNLPELSFLDGGLVSLYQKEYLVLALHFFSKFISRINIPKDTKEFIQNHFVVTRKNVNKSNEVFREFSSNDLQNCIRLAKHISACSLEENMSTLHYSNGYKLYEEIHRRMEEYLR